MFETAYASSPARSKNSSWSAKAGNRGQESLVHFAQRAAELEDASSPGGDVWIFDQFEDLCLPKMLSNANAFEIKEDETEDSLFRRSECNNVAVGGKPLDGIFAHHSRDHVEEEVGAALGLVTRAVAQAGRQDIRPSSEAPQSLEVVVADNLDSKVSLWPRFRSSIDGFETINKAARWDYQRDTIYIRSDAKLKRAKRKGTNRVKRTIRVSKVVLCEPLRVCPRCQRKATQTFRRVTKCLHDLRFSRSGVTGCVVKYQFEIIELCVSQRFCDSNPE